MSKHLSVSYSKAGDMLKVYWDDEPSFADTPPIDRDDVVLLRALSDEALIVGCKIHDLSAVLDRAGFKLVPKGSDSNESGCCPSCKGEAPNGCNYCNSGGL